MSKLRNPLETLKKLRIEDWIQVLLALVAYSVPSGISAFILNSQAVEERHLTPVITTVLSFGAIAVAYVNLRQLGAFRGRISTTEKTISQLALNLMLRELVKDVTINSGNSVGGQAPPAENFRGNIMLIGKNGQLYIAYHFNIPNQDELQLKWKSGEGCCGQAWADKKQRVADLTIEVSEYGPDWRYPSELHRKLTQQVKSLVSTPIRQQNDPGTIIGILNVDSIDPFAISQLDSSAMLIETQSKATLLAPLLEQLNDQ